MTLCLCHYKDDFVIFVALLFRNAKVEIFLGDNWSSFLSMRGFCPNSWHDAD